MESLPLIFLSEVKNGDSYGLWPMERNNKTKKEESIRI